MSERARTSIDVPKDLWKEFQHRCLDLELTNTKALELALRLWLDTNAPSRRRGKK